jgi:ATP-binding cassette, subfamily B, bacterial
VEGNLLVLTESKQPTAGGPVASGIQDAAQRRAEERLRSRSRRDLVSTAWRHLADERRTVVGLGLLAVIAAQAESAALVLIALTADTVARGEDQIDIDAGPVSASIGMAPMGVLTVIALALTAVVVLIYGRLTARIAARLERQARDEVVSSYAGADWEYQSTQKASRVHGRLRLMHARSGTFVGLVGWTRALTSIAVFVTAAAVISPFAALVIVVFGAVLSVAVLPIRRRAVRIAIQAAEQEVGLSEDVGEAIDQGPDVKVFGAWPAFGDRFDARSGTLQQLRARAGAVRALLPVVYQYGAFLLILLVMFAAWASDASGNVGQFAAAALLLLRSVQYGQQLQQSLHTIADSVPGVERLQRELQVPPPRVVPGTGTLRGVGAVRLRDVSYEYPGSETPALHNVSVDLHPGTIVGIAGPSGSGKSTLAQILLRLRWPTAGQYLIDGRPAEEYSITSWNRLACHVPQQPRLLHGTLADNVSFFDESISREKIAATLSAVGLGELVDSMPGGLDADVGPTSRNLSGGQVQRIGIARALVRDPRLVVLDEPTSALDVNAERLVGDALGALRGRPDVLVIVIAHRPSTLALCDEIVVLQDGRVTATGRSRDVAGQSEFFASTRGEDWVPTREPRHRRALTG